MSLSFEMKTCCMLKGVISKSHDSQIVPNANFENGGTTIQISTLHVLLNISSISLLTRVHDTFGYIEMQKESNVNYFSKKINKMQVAG